MTVARVIPAPPDAVFAAFLDPDKLLAWLPPGLKAQDNDEGARLSLENLARLFA